MARVVITVEDKGISAVDMEVNGDTPEEGMSLVMLTPAQQVVAVMLASAVRIADKVDLHGGTDE